MAKRDKATPYRVIDSTDFRRDFRRLVEPVEVRWYGHPAGIYLPVHPWVQWGQWRPPIRGSSAHVHNKDLLDALDEVDSLIKELERAAWEHAKEYGG